MPEEEIILLPLTKRKAELLSKAMSLGTAMIVGDYVSASIFMSSCRRSNAFRTPEDQQAWNELQDNFFALIDKAWPNEKRLVSESVVQDGKVVEQITRIEGTKDG